MPVSLAGILGLGKCLNLPNAATKTPCLSSRVNEVSDSRFKHNPREPSRNSNIMFRAMSPSKRCNSENIFKGSCHGRRIRVDLATFLGILAIFAKKTPKPPLFFVENHNI